MTTAIQQDDYRVALDAFQGPLDLLLFLIRRAEIDITDIPVAEITDQYLEYLHGVESIDVEMAGEFLVMAATLIELKSRTLAPVPREGEDGEQDGESGRADGGEASDPRFDLVRQLLAYQRFRVASEELDDRRREFSLRYPARPGKRREADAGDASGDGQGIGEEENDDDDFSTEALELELEDVHILDIADAYEAIMRSIDFTRLGDHVVEMDDTPIALHQEDLLDRLRHASGGRLTLQDAFTGCPRIQCVGLFLATLELARTRRVTVIQDEIESPIELILLDEDDADQTPNDVRASGDDADGETTDSVADSDADSNADAAASSRP